MEGMFRQEYYERLNVFSKLKKTRRKTRAMCALRRVYAISGSVQYLSLMDVFPSVLCGCVHRRIYVHGSLMMGLA